MHIHHFLFRVAALIHCVWCGAVFGCRILVFVSRWILFGCCCFFFFVFFSVFLLYYIFHPLMIWCMAKYTYNSTKHTFSAAISSAAVACLTSFEKRIHFLINNISTRKIVFNIPSTRERESRELLNHFHVKRKTFYTFRYMCNVCVCVI